MSDSLIIAFALSLCLIPIYFGVRAFLRGDHKPVLTPTMLLTNQLIERIKKYAEFETIEGGDGLFTHGPVEELCNINLDDLIKTSFDLVSDVINKKDGKKLILYSTEMMFKGLHDHDKVKKVVSLYELILARRKLQNKLAKKFEIKLD